MLPALPSRRRRAFTAQAAVTAGLLATLSCAHAGRSTVVDLQARPGVTQRMLVVEPDTAARRAAAVLVPGGHGALQVLASPISSDSAFVKGQALWHFPLDQLRLPVLVLAQPDVQAASAFMLAP